MPDVSLIILSVYSNTTHLQAGLLANGDVLLEYTAATKVMLSVLMSMLLISQQTTCSRTPLASHGRFWTHESNQDMSSCNFSSSLRLLWPRNRSIIGSLRRLIRLRKASDDSPRLMRYSITASLSRLLLM